VYPVTKRGERVILREISVADVDAVKSVCCHPSVIRNLGFAPRGRDEASAVVARAIASARRVPRTEYLLLVVLEDRDEAVGVMRLTLDLDCGAEFGVAVDPPHSAQIWGAVREGGAYQEHGREGTRLLLALGFDDLGLHRLWGAEGLDSATPERPVLHAGMGRERIIRDLFFTWGGWRGTAVYSILLHEWELVRARENGVVRL